MAYNNLPVEVLRCVIEHLPSRADQLSCCLVNRALWDISTTFLYKDIDLTVVDHDEEIYEQSLVRQARLLQSISINPELGSRVRKFKNHNTLLSDVTDVTKSEGEYIDADCLISAAKNMTSLSHADLTANLLAAYIIEHIDAYPYLEHLSVDGLDPKHHIWNLASTSLKQIEWHVPCIYSTQRPSAMAKFLTDVVEATCPVLESLEIAKCTDHTQWLDLVGVPPDRLEQYEKIADNPRHLPLQHFGLSGGGYFDQKERERIEAFMLNVVKSYSQSLTSVKVPITICCDRDMLQFFLKVCSILPNLKRLYIAWRSGDIDFRSITPHEFFNSLVANTLALGREIEHFAVSSIGCPLTSEIGSIFRSWSYLKVLRIGDGDNGRSGPYGLDGLIDFESYQPLYFIKKLPQSLEELYIEINGVNLKLGYGKDFIPICSIGTHIFKALRRLHTCDIVAWISDADGTTGSIPEKAVHYRRLGHESRSNKTKNAWTSRRECIYQETAKFIIEHSCAEVTLESDEGVFEGMDAESIWLDGDSDEHFSQNSEDGRQSDNVEKSYIWPDYEERILSYPMYARC